MRLEKEESKRRTIVALKENYIVQDYNMYARAYPEYRSPEIELISLTWLYYLTSCVKGFYENKILKTVNLRETFQR